MTHQNSQLATTSQIMRPSITVKRAFTLQQYIAVVHQTKAYYTAIKQNLRLPKEVLPHLNILIDAAMIVDAYIQNQATPSLKLYNAVLDAKTIATVWMFANEPTLNIQLGKHQLFVIKHN
ncbi:hypothetical protein ES692_05990 [Psychroserpens burtonensis]|uniref:Uncharacterized protein n=1 Tax=Psychroserpens burtonensis TaxID=49278 RepID=A0A5C7BAK7_9FLAO|nr:hypothetical protein [Psychroserpens burtonensis]TXE18591.1 hypothetical protein ES692_05990 [Psychroserpens burtonensis]